MKSLQLLQIPIKAACPKWVTINRGTHHEIRVPNRLLGIVGRPALYKLKEVIFKVVLKQNQWLANIHGAIKDSMVDR